MDLTDKTTRALLGWKLESQTNEELELKQLKAYLDATEKHGDTKANIRYQALKLKYEVLTTVPTTIEETMSPAQLYASGSPLWTNEYRGHAIERILRQLEEKPRTEESVNVAPTIIRNGKNTGKMMFNEFGNLGRSRH